MKKTGLKTFIYSFSISLFVIFAANGLTAREEKTQSSRNYNNGKNISLFFKKEAAAAGAQTIPVKKIALSIPKEEEAKAQQAPEEAEELKLASVEEKPNETNAQKPAHFKEQENHEATSQDEEMILALLEGGDDANKESDREYWGDAESLIPLERKDAEREPANLVKEAAESDKNQVAMSEGDASLKEMAKDGFDINDSEFEDAPAKPDWKPMEEIKPDAGSPWVVAKGAKHPNNNLVLEQDYAKEQNKPLLIAKDSQSNEEVLASAEIVKNILIPIPEDIMKQENLTPQLVVSDDDMQALSVSQDASEEIRDIIDKENDKKGILSSIKSIFSNSNTAKNSEDTAEKDSEFFSSLNKGLKSGASNKRNTKILPTEMKLSFQPNRAEISGQTLRWVHAFANKAKEEDGVVLEIRINGAGPHELQQRRLNLLNTILQNRGLEHHKVNTIFTNREQNSFVLRVVKMSEDRSRMLERKAKERETLPYYHYAGSKKPQNFQQW